MANYAQNLMVPNLARGVEAGISMRRNIEEVRDMMQQRENMRVAKKTLATVAQRIEQMSGQARESQAEYKDLMRQMQAGREVDQKRLYGAQSLFLLDTIELANQKNALYMQVMSTAPDNPILQQQMGKMVEQNQLQLSKLSDFLKGGMEEVGAGEREMTAAGAKLGVEGMKGERAALQRRHEMDVERLRAGTKLQVAGMKQAEDRPDMAEITMDAMDYVDASVDQEEWERMAEESTARVPQIKRAAVNYVAGRMAQGEAPNINQFMQDYQDALQKDMASEAERAAAEGAAPTGARVAGRAVRKAAPGAARKAAMAPAGALGQAAQTLYENRKTARDFIEGLAGK